MVKMYPSLLDVPCEVLIQIMESLPDDQTLQTLTRAHPAAAIALNLFGDNLFLALGIIDFSWWNEDDAYESGELDALQEKAKPYLADAPPPVGDLILDPGQRRRLRLLATGVQTFLEHVNSKATATTSNRPLSPIERARMTRALLRFEFMARFLHNMTPSSRYLKSPDEHLKRLMGALPSRCAVEEVRCVFSALTQYFCGFLVPVLVRRDCEFVARLHAARSPCSSSALPSSNGMGTLRWADHSFRLCPYGWRPGLRVDELVGITAKTSLASWATCRAIKCAMLLALECELVLQSFVSWTHEKWVHHMREHLHRDSESLDKYDTILEVFRKNICEEDEVRKNEPPQPFAGDALDKPNKGWVQGSRIIQTLSEYSNHWSGMMALGGQRTFWAATTMPWSHEFWVFLDEERVDMELTAPVPDPSETGREEKCNVFFGDYRAPWVPKVGWRHYRFKIRMNVSEGLSY
ncbi:hypothetical protein ACHAQA_009569 [Verticillium albo-atrum]